MRKAALLVAGLVCALAVVTAGTAGVKALITGAQIQDGTIKSRDIGNGAIRRLDIAPATVASLRGRRGPAGPRGLQGSQGPQGSPGATGAQGLAGPTGAQGATGSAGAAGPKGDPGAGVHVTGSVATAADLPETGSDGDAYIVTSTGDLHVWDGDAWINTGPVVGPAGPQGETGPAGPQGPAGPVGPAGPSVTVANRAAPFSLAAEDAELFTVQCAAGEQAVSGGFTYTSDALVLSSDTAPTGAGDGWQLFLVNLSDTLAVSGTLHVVCLS